MKNHTRKIRAQKVSLQSMCDLFRREGPLDKPSQMASKEKEAINKLNSGTLSLKDFGSFSCSKFSAVCLFFHVPAGKDAAPNKNQHCDSDSMFMLFQIEWYTLLKLWAVTFWHKYLEILTAWWEMHGEEFWVFSFHWSCFVWTALVRLRQVQYLQEPDLQRVGLHPRHLLLPRGTR